MCEDLHGQVTQILPIISAAEFNTTHDGECRNFSGVQLGSLTVTTSSNLKGADLARAYFSFVYLTNGDFSGANLDGIQGGYISFIGIRDKYTRLPSLFDCDNNLGKKRINCTR